MRAIDRKLARDLWHLRGQALAIALVMACGVATYVMFLATLDSLQVTRAEVYRTLRFAEVFAPLTRAPERVAARIAEIPAVDRVDTRVVAPVTIDVSGFAEPITGLITSLPAQGEPLLNRLFLKSGRSVEPGRDDEVVASEAFAEAHGLEPGDALAVTIKGRRKRLTLVGTAVSPEHIAQLRPGGVFPDFKRYGVLWMAREPLAAAFEMEGAFNHVVLTLARGASAQAVIDPLDDLLRPYGGGGAVARADQLSNRFLSDELRQLENSSRLFPYIFLGVAAFLLNVVVTRLVGTQREQIAALKAFGYGNGAVGLHFLKLVLVITMTGALIGIGAGAWLTRVMGEIYMGFFRLPWLEYRLPVGVIGGALAASLAAGALGTLVAVRAAVRLRPAEAMRPEPPAVYRRTLIERGGIGRVFTAPTRMILRHLGHRPGKTALAGLGIAMAVAILMTGRFQEDTVTFMMDLHFGLSQREDLAVSFVEPTSRRAVHELTALPGVEHSESFRSVGVRLRNGHRSQRTAILGVEPDSTLKRLFDTELRQLELPRSGLVLSDYLAGLLAVRPGEQLTVEVLEGERLVREVAVAAVVRQYLGVSGYMDLDALNRLLGEGAAISGAYLTVEPGTAQSVYAALKDRPRIAGTTVRVQEIHNFRRIMDETMLFWTALATVFAALIAVGVVYNSARIALTERSRDLATLRVLGFTRGEISYILLGELAFLTLAAIPPGLFIGRLLCGYIAAMVESDLYRIPLILEPDTYAFAAAVVLAASALSALVVRRRLDRLDLVAVLKTRE